jgi:hypothetical protein
VAQREVGLSTEFDVEVYGAMDGEMTTVSVTNLYT